VRHLAALPALLALLLTACAPGSNSITVGSKDFTEQRILGEMVALLAENGGVRVDRVVPFPTDVAPLRGLVDGTIDIYVEYTGTALLELGQAPLVSPDEAFELLVEESGDYGLTWLTRLGFSNDYVLTVTAETAARLGLESISDLDSLRTPPRFGGSTDFERRPLDGLDALVSRYGLRIDGDVLATDDKTELYDALRSGAVAVAQGFSTDPQIDELDLVVLEDDLEFFPAYEAAPVARTDSLEAFPGLEQAVASLAGQLDEETMRRLIGQVIFEGREASVVARDELVSLGLIPAGFVQDRGDAVLVAIGLDDERSGPTGRALEAIRRAYPGRPVEVVFAPDPADAVLRGDARIAVADAETVFQPIERTAGEDRPVKPLEAIAAVELRALHLLAPSPDTEVSSVAVGGPNSPSYETALTLLESDSTSELSLVQEPGGTIEDRVDAVLTGRADAALVVTPLGNADVQRAITNNGMVLLPLRAPGGAPAEQAPHLRLARIPAGSYIGQDDAVTTFSQQTVLVAPVSRLDEPGVYGPNAFVGGPAQPLASAAVATVQQELDGPRVDPSLPRTPRPLTDPQELVQPTNPAPLVSIGTLVVVLALAGLGYLLARSPSDSDAPPGRADDDGSNPNDEPPSEASADARSSDAASEYDDDGVGRVT
jgi:osmoprotectant transport system permease protein